MIRFYRHRNGVRCRVLKRRLHHGLVGCCVAAAGLTLKWPRLFLAGLALVIHDIHDFPWRWAR